jgi:activator of HSP90 ATPase
MADSFEISIYLPGIPAVEIFQAWLESEGHSEFTGSRAQIEPRVNGVFSAWDGYISGRTLEIEPSHRILQSWRTTEFPEGSPDSQLEILFEEIEGGTQLRLIHTNIPAGQGEDYRQGWQEFYFQPMQKYFSK